MCLVEKYLFMFLFTFTLKFVKYPQTIWSHIFAYLYIHMLQNNLKELTIFEAWR